jgi:hypothetical protein
MIFFGFFVYKDSLHFSTIFTKSSSRFELNANHSAYNVQIGNPANLNALADNLGLWNEYGSSVITTGHKNKNLSKVRINIVETIDQHWWEQKASDGKQLFAVDSGTVGEIAYINILISFPFEDEDALNSRVNAELIRGIFGLVSHTAGPNYENGDNEIKRAEINSFISKYQKDYPNILVATIK